jgi:hypothetical protein
MGGHTIKAPDRDWLAQSDGIGHSQPRFGRDRTACGLQRIDPRFAHSIKVQCVECRDVVGVTVRRPAPITESEHRLLDGNR